MGRGLLDKLADSINPFFRHYSTSRTFGVLVAAAMAAGVIALTIANARCTVISNLDVRYQEVFGSFANQKLFIDTHLERPMGLSSSVKRTASSCTVYTSSLVFDQFQRDDGMFQRNEMHTGSCIFPPPEYLDALDFPSAFHWCEFDELPESLKTIFRQQPAGRQTPRSAAETQYDDSFPGWRCDYSNMIPEWSSYCSSVDSSIDYVHCGTSIDGSFDWTRGYYTMPEGAQVPYYHGYVASVSTEEEVCPFITNAVGAAIGYMGLIEMISTFLIVGTLVCLGIAKPRSDKASNMNMMKGSGIAEFAEEMEKYKQENGEAGTSSKVTKPSKVAPDQLQFGDKFDPNTGKERPKFNPETGAANW